MTHGTTLRISRVTLEELDEPSFQELQSNIRLLRGYVLSVLFYRVAYAEEIPIDSKSSNNGTKESSTVYHSPKN